MIKSKYQEGDIVSISYRWNTMYTNGQFPLEYDDTKKGLGCWILIDSKDFYPGSKEVWEWRPLSAIINRYAKGKKTGPGKPNNDLASALTIKSPLQAEELVRTLIPGAREWFKD